MTWLCCCSERINAAELKNKGVSHTNLDICSVSKAKQKTHLQSKEKVWLCAASSNSTPLISISLTGDDYRCFLSFFFTGNKWHSTLHLFTDSYARLFYVPQQNILFTTKSASTARIFTRLINWNFLWWWSHTACIVLLKIALETWFPLSQSKNCTSFCTRRYRLLLQASRGSALRFGCNCTDEQTNIHGGIAWHPERGQFP